MGSYIPKQLCQPATHCDELLCVVSRLCTVSPLRPCRGTEQHHTLLQWTSIIN